MLLPDVPPTQVREMLPGDLAQAVDLQLAFLEGSLVTELGSAFLSRFYATALEHRATRAFVAVDDDRVIGVAVASLEVRDFNSYVKPRILGALATALLWPGRWPLAIRMLRTLVESTPEPIIPAELLLLVVHGRVRHQGIGRQLLRTVEHAFARQGVSRYRVAVRSHLAVARAFYQSLGFTFEQELAVLGRPMTYLTKDVPH
jgi:ribosomal protein S18 acetylase RimI-like enzyme